MSRVNTALWAQSTVGLSVAVFTLATTLTPFSKAAAIISVVLSVNVVIALLALLFELAMIPFKASTIRTAVPDFITPWAVLGALGTFSVIGAEMGVGLRGDWAVWLMRLGSLLAIVVSLTIVRQRPFH